MRKHMNPPGLLAIGIGLVVLVIVINACHSPVPGTTPTPQASAVESSDGAQPECAILPTHSSSPPAETREISASHTLAFSTINAENISLANLDGREPQTLTQHPAQDMSPVWSPDGTRIAFNSYRNDLWGVYLMNSDGSQVVHIGDGQGSDWSPDGTRVLFVYNADGTLGHLRQWSTTGITTLLRLEQAIASPTWSPDGNRIVFTTYKENVWLWLVDPDGRNASKLIKGQRPAWSPDGSFIAFRGEGADIALITPDGSCHTVLTSDLFWSDEPAWSPDGHQIAFVSSEQGEVASHIFVMKSDGSERTQITTEEAVYSSPVWSPDGRYLAYVQKHLVQNKWTIAVLDMHDPDAQPQEIAWGRQPAWQPLP